MVKRRVLAIGLDGFEISLAERLIAAGELPALAGFARRSARFLLDHGRAQRTGLAWEHVSTGLAPERSGRWAAVSFDTANYTVWQEGTRSTPFLKGLPTRAVVFDAPYFDMTSAISVRGLVGWGAHDAGIASCARPDDLLPEFLLRFGPYPAKEWIYGFAWPNAERCRAMGAALANAVDLRSRAARWLLKERLPDWDLGLIVVSEPHSAIEGLWHGVDPGHPLHGLPSGVPAEEGLWAVYRAVDRLVRDLIQTFEDATIVLFSMGGMGSNRSDVASMVLLPELLYRNAFGCPLLRRRQDWERAPGGVPLLADQDNWSRDVGALVPPRRTVRGTVRGRISRLIPERVKRRIRSLTGGGAELGGRSMRLSLGWMPATRYQPYWSEMPAFALPSFYDGRIRINLIGREREGKVGATDYSAVCDDLERLLHDCRDPMTGEGVVEFIERPGASRDPLEMGPTEADLVVVWRGPLAIDHPTLGQIGPIPYRRTGGHTGPYGVAYLYGAGLSPGEHGIRSSFDVVPTIIDLLDLPPQTGLSGTTLLHEDHVRA